jgi:hypothetical protein
MSCGCCCRWSRGLPDGTAVSADDFYSDGGAQQLYRSFVAMLLGRVNTLSGVAYRWARVYSEGVSEGEGRLLV